MRIVAMIMAGGEGTRLSVLSEKRAKPSVPFAGKFRIIDFTLSNCVNSGIFDVAVLTQYRPHSLNAHIGNGKPWDLDRNRGGVELLQPYQGRDDQSWYKGTADAVYQNLNYIRQQRADVVVVLSGDHIYKMDYSAMVAYHQRHHADVTVAVMHVSVEQTDRFGIMTADESMRIVEFTEKPKSKDKGTLANMGVYVFSTDMLFQRLEEGSDDDPRDDFGKHVIPSMINRDRVMAYPFEGYWVDVGTIDSYWETSMDLLNPENSLNLFDPDWVIHTRSEERSPANVGPQARISQGMICNGCIVRGHVENSVLSPGVYISPGATVRDSVVMNDTWIGPGAVLDKVIVDKNVVVGSGVRLGDGDDVTTPNQLQPDKLMTGISIVGKGAHIPAGVRIGRNVVINADRDEEDFPSNEVLSGETI
ncbi:MAG: glucose-1-phosphate adenylyltransferase [Chloroflexi bacterium AL-W]|nr:glucose-1-phosphate adenylyltransferase [Chloroflexi bacterium AL-N1]NOK68907.1 glucose-1-phosphate adenylyltransferase [Chloroflexi bacterium AL-N10]NOK76890.1 glucose-1-phosphate adenylyltransferase [Chloroflexi bacterium AL-N5]NOK82722.1 glucose-1-phosphate adenylyltransferase [Chloroflexi bacterium AL-W]NOK90747.1 glucose-1-phosphate adenylyltransferase [Chloroflexi bacterium AL-N15]